MLTRTKIFMNDCIVYVGEFIELDSCLDKEFVCFYDFRLIIIDIIV